MQAILLLYFDPLGDRCCWSADRFGRVNETTVSRIPYDSSDFFSHGSLLSNKFDKVILPRLDRHPVKRVIFATEVIYGKTKNTEQAIT
jgi:hypothetical protein